MHYNSENLKFAEQMRSNMTPQELKLWCIVRAKKFYGYKFKRQVLIGNYIVDFLCPDKKLIVEIDGGQHNSNNNIKTDEDRTKYINDFGYKVIRFWNNDIDKNIEGVCQKLKEVLEEI